MRGVDFEIWHDAVEPHYCVALDSMKLLLALRLPQWRACSALMTRYGQATSGAYALYMVLRSLQQYDANIKSSDIVSHLIL